MCGGGEGYQRSAALCVPHCQQMREPDSGSGVCVCVRVYTDVRPASGGDLGFEAGAAHQRCACVGAEPRPKNDGSECPSIMLKPNELNCESAPF